MEVYQWLEKVNNVVYKRRRLNKFLDRALKLLAVVNFVLLAMINDFEGIDGLIQILGMIATELILVGIISRWGRND